MDLNNCLLSPYTNLAAIRYSAICLHLDHNREYVEQTMIEANLLIRKATKLNKCTKTRYGIAKV